MFLQPAGVAPPRHLIPAGVQRLPADRLYRTGPELAAGGGLLPACGATVRMCPGWACGKMNQAQAVVSVAAELRLFLRPGRRSAPVAVALDGTSSLGHVVESLGVPLTDKPAACWSTASRPRPGTGLATQMW